MISKCILCYVNIYSIMMLCKYLLYNDVCCVTALYINVYYFRYCTLTHIWQPAPLLHLPPHTRRHESSRFLRCGGWICRWCRMSRLRCRWRRRRPFRMLSSRGSRVLAKCFLEYHPSLLEHRTRHVEGLLRDPFIARIAQCGSISKELNLQLMAANGGKQRYSAATVVGQWNSYSMHQLRRLWRIGLRHPYK